MRTKTLAVAAILAAGVASSMAQSNVYSLNVVGYVNKTFAGAGKYTLIANPLNTTNNTIELIKAAVPVGGKVLKWNGSSFDIINRVAFGTGWTPSTAGTNTLNPGEGAFVQTAAASPDQTNTFVGEVLQGTLDNIYPAGYTLSGNKVPDSGPVTSMQMTNVPTNSKLLKWDSAGGVYFIYNKLSFGWTPSTPTLDPADGFFMNAASPFTWTRNFTVQ
jgi:hypothetical protein